MATSRSPAVKAYVKHARQYGDARSVFEAAEDSDSFSSLELGYLAAQLRKTKPIKENAHYLINAGQRNERRQDWPPFKLTTERYLHAKPATEDAALFTAAFAPAASDAPLELVPLTAIRIAEDRSGTNKEGSHDGT
jgi:hypothetical protein